MCVLLVCNRRQPCVDHLPFPETPDEFQKEQLGPKWFSNCTDKCINRSISGLQRSRGTRFGVQLHLEVSEGEDDRLREVDSASSSVHRGRDNMGVNNEGPASRFGDLP